MRRQFLLAGLLSLLPGRSRAQDIVPPALAGVAAQVLTRLIEAARSQAIADGVQPLPASIRRGLLGYFPDGVLGKVRYAAGRSDDNALPSLAFGYGDAAAVTLGDVVIFKDPSKARADLKLWAHELTHVLQYQRWGIDGFAEHYVRDSKAVEKEAYDNADRFEIWRRR